MMESYPQRVPWVPLKGYNHVSQTAGGHAKMQGLIPEVPRDADAWGHDRA